MSDKAKSVADLLAALAVDSIKGSERFLAVAFAIAGNFGVPVDLDDVMAHWPRHLMNAGYSPKFYPMAKKEKWVLPHKKGSLIITKKGLEHINSLLTPNPRVVKGLMIFGKKTPHTFDKTLRNLLKDSSTVVIADTYVDDSIFDTILDEIPRNAAIRLLWGKVSPSARQTHFDARATRFGIEYSNFLMKKYAGFHDRFLVIDGVGYILGPSLKDAAAVKPATLVGLNDPDSKALGTFFDDLWVEGV